MTKYSMGSLFAGVGGFDLGFEQQSIECRFQVEWDKNCQQTLAHHWPHVPRWGDVSDVNGAELPPVDIITYGFPCQDLSIAGQRAGLDGDRSNLFFQAVRIIKEMREATNGLHPTWAVAENVPGLLNADAGSAMARVLDTLAEAGALVIEWVTLDAQWFGVPQRRRRVFVAACFDSGTADRCPDPLFPVAESGARNPATRDPSRETVAGLASTGVGTDSIQRVTGTLAAGAHPGSYNGQDAYNDMLIPFVKAKRAQTDTDDETWEPDRPAPTLNAFDQGDTRTTVAVLSFDTQFGSNANVFENQSPTLKSTQTSPSVTQPIAFSAGNSAHARSIAITENGTPPLRAGASGTNQTPTVMTPELAVRRLTPLECERLMGWPDNHTLHRADGKTNSDSARYKQCGNGVAAPVAAWIAKHLKATL